MKFRAYDLIAQVIPGYVVIAVLDYFFDITFIDIASLSSVVIAYVVGYYLNTLSSWMEGVYFFFWRGVPSTKLLQDQGYWNVRLYESVAIRESLLDDTGSENPAFQFATALDAVSDGSNPRVQEFNESYSFSRGMLTCALVISVVVLTSEMEVNFITVFLLVLLVLISSIRAKQRAYYYVREVLATYWNLKKQQSNQAG
ncbi:MAG: hypothetical protein AAF433_06985 [Bacteroidota bacterium]